MNKNGVSMVALVITMIVIIIIAGITYNMSMSNVGKAQKSSFMADLENAVYSLQAYETRAQAAFLMENENANQNFNSKELKWDGQSERAENTARIEDKNGTLEDRIDYILDNGLTKNLENKIIIKEGVLYVLPQYETEYEWACEVYDYMK
jgi:Tfp pilus assembly protein PilE